MANPKGNPENLNAIRSGEEARKLGHNGGIKSGEVRRKKRDAKSAIRLLLGMSTTQPLEDTLRNLGYTESDWTNLNALIVSMFNAAIDGDTKAAQMLLDYGGFHPDQKGKDRERKARIASLEQSRASLISSGAEGEDVMVYLPENGRDKPLPGPEEGDDFPCKS